MTEALILVSCFFVVSMLYGSVGHGGASGYLAVMTLASLAPETLRPTALVLNMAVSLVGTVLFFRAGHFRGTQFWPFAAVSIPMAWLGGRFVLHDAAFKILLAVALGIAGLRLFLPLREAEKTVYPAWWAVLLVGGSIGLASGLIGVGGGIFLTPVLLFCGWGNAKQAAAASAPFIFVNSFAGFLGQGLPFDRLQPLWPFLLVAVLAGGSLGSSWGSGRALGVQLRAALGIVLLVAVIKLVV